MSHRVLGQDSLNVEPISRSGALLERLSSLAGGQPIAALLSWLYTRAP